MPRPLTISEAARRLKRTRVTVRRRVRELGMVFEVAMTATQYRRLERSFYEHPTLPRNTSIR